MAAMVTKSMMWQEISLIFSHNIMSYIIISWIWILIILKNIHHQLFKLFCFLYLFLLVNVTCMVCSLVCLDWSMSIDLSTALHDESGSVIFANNTYWQVWFKYMCTFKYILKSSLLLVLRIIYTKIRTINI